jgi:AraC family transcriptional regulator
MTNIKTNKIIDKAVLTTLFETEFYQIDNWNINFTSSEKGRSGYNDCFCIVFVKHGNFAFDISKESFEIHNGSIIIEKPNYEYRLRPTTGESTIFNFKPDFYTQLIEDLNLSRSFFFSNSNMLSLMLKATPHTEYLYYQILRKFDHAGKFEIDNLVMELLTEIMASFTNDYFNIDLSESLKTFHLGTVEKAKEYMNENFNRDISLNELSDFCCVSPYHFSRIFKKITAFTPYSYLSHIRLKHAEMLIKNSSLPISEISFSSGFNSPEYFATAFKQKYKVTPRHYRNAVS